MGQSTIHEILTHSERHRIVEMYVSLQQSEGCDELFDRVLAAFKTNGMDVRDLVVGEEMTLPQHCFGKNLA